MAAEKDDCSRDKYGVFPMIQSTEKPDRVLHQIKRLGAEQAEQNVWIRGRLHTSRTVGKLPIEIACILAYINAPTFSEMAPPWPNW